MPAVTENAPKLVDWLDEECAAHFAGSTKGLDALGIEHHLEPRLVRGFDYYTRTTFEFAARHWSRAERGRRRRSLRRARRAARRAHLHPGSVSASASRGCCSHATRRAASRSNRRALDAFVVDLTGGAAARDLCEELRRAGLGAERAFDGQVARRSQMKLADRSGATVAMIVGPEELAAGEVTLRELRSGGPRGESRGRRSWARWHRVDLRQSVEQTRFKGDERDIDANAPVRGAEVWKT